MKLVKGITRTVILTKHYAVKLPSFRSWKFFLMGLLANMHEAFWWRETVHDPRLCPVYFCLPGGWFLVMPRVEVCWDQDIDYSKYEGLPLDPKPTNFGVYQGRTVLIDYGS